MKRPMFACVMSGNIVAAGGKPVGADDNREGLCGLPVVSPARKVKYEILNVPDDIPQDPRSIKPIASLFFLSVLKARRS